MNFTSLTTSWPTFQVCMSWYLSWKLKIRHSSTLYTHLALFLFSDDLGLLKSLHILDLSANHWHSMDLWKIGSLSNGLRKQEQSLAKHFCRRKNCRRCQVTGSISGDNNNNNNEGKTSPHSDTSFEQVGSQVDLNKRVQLRIAILRTFSTGMWKMMCEDAKNYINVHHRKWKLDLVKNSAIRFIVVALNWMPKDFTTVDFLVEPCSTEAGFPSNMYLI